MKKKHGRISVLLILAIVIQIFTPFMNNIGYAGRKETVIDNITVEKGKMINGKISYDIKAEWSIEDGSKKQGDTFTLKLPEQFEFNTPQNTLYLISSTGEIYAEGKISGSNIKFIFSNLVEKELGVGGDFWITGLTTKPLEGEKDDGIIHKNVEIKEDDNPLWEGQIEIDTGNIKEDSQSTNYYNFNFRKSPQKDVEGYAIEIKDGYIYLQWKVDINTAEPSKRYKGDISVEDIIEDKQELVEDSFELQYGKYFDESNSYIDGIKSIRAFKDGEESVNKLDLDKKSFKFNMRVDSSNYYILSYKTKISKEDFLKDNANNITSYTNHVNLYHNGSKVESSTGQYDFSGMGSAGLDNLSGCGKIKLVKFDEELGENKKLKGASFEIEKLKKDEKKELIIDKDFTLLTEETDNNGEIKLDVSSGIYRFTEIKAPDEYLKLEEPIVKVFDFGKVNQIIELYNKNGSKYMIDNSEWISKNLDSTLGFLLEEAEEEQVDFIMENYFNLIGYDMEEEAFVIKVANKKNTKDLEINKNWIVDEEYKEDLKDKNIVAEFTVDAYKVSNNGKPILLSEENEIDKKVIDKIYDITENGKTNKIFWIDYNRGNRYVIEDLPIADDQGNEYVYTIKERELKGFESSGDKTIKLANYLDNPVAIVNFTNTFKPSGNIRILKQDMDNDPLEGVKFKLTREEGNILYFGTSDKDGEIYFNDLPAGTYTLEETEALEGYERLEEEIKFKVTDNGEIELIGEIDSAYVNFVEDDETFQVKNKKEAKSLGNIRILKQDMDNDPLEGVKFKLRREEGNILYYGTSDEKGKIKFKNLPEGTYSLEETEALEGYEPLEGEIKFKVIEEGEIELIEEIDSVYVNFVEDDKIFQVKNKKKDKKIGEIEILKQDMDNTPLQGVKFKLRREEGNILYYGTSDKEGKIKFKNLPAGTYTLKETETLEGYEILEEEIKFKVIEEGEIELIEEIGSAYVNFVEDDKTFQVKNKKKDKKLGEIEILKQDMDNDPLEGVKFKLRREEGNILYYGTSDKDGKIKFKNLPAGTYTLKETEALEGYEPLEEEIKFEVIEEGEIELIEEIGSAYVNFVKDDKIFQVKNKKKDKKLGEIEILKQDMDNDPLEGVKFKLTGEEGNILYYGTSDKEGKIKFKNLPEGTYTLEETEALEGYERLEGEIKFKVTDNGEIKLIGEIDSAYVNFVKDDKTFQVKNKKKDKKLGEIEILKQDMDNTALEGVKFKLRREEGNILYYGTSDKEGKIKFKNLPAGTYTLKETEALEGYERLEEEIKFKVIEEGEIELIEEIGSAYVNFVEEYNIFQVKNKKKDKKIGEIEILKQDMDNDPLEGVKFKLRREEGNILYYGTSDKDGKIKFKNLPAGTYTLKETEALEGYERLEGEIKFKVIEEGKIELIEEIDPAYVNFVEEYNIFQVKNRLVINDSLVNIKVMIQDSNGQPLKGAEFKLEKTPLEKSYSRKARFIDFYNGISNEKGEIVFTKIDQGLYKLKQTKTLDGYKKLEEIIEFKVTKEGKLELAKEIESENASFLSSNNVFKIINDKANGLLNPEIKPDKPGITKPIIPEPEPVNPIEPEIPEEPEIEEPEEPEEPEIPEVPEEEEAEEPEEDVGGVIVEPEEPEIPELEEPEEPEIPEEEEPEEPEEDLGGVIVDPEEDKEEPVKPEEDVAGVVVDKEEDKVEDKAPALPKTGENSTIFLLLGLVFIMTGIILKRKIFA